MRLLVAGGDRVDAGKTTFSTGLCAHAGATGFKPRAGNDYWFDHDDYRRAVEEGRLYGKDAKRLAAASAAAVRPEDVNPVHRLWRPAPRESAGLLGPSRRRFVCDRVGDRYLVNAVASVPPSARDHLPVSDAPRVESVAELNEYTRRWHLPAFDRIRERVLEAPRAVVESYADIARPLADLEFDAAAVVEPGRARVYDGAPYVEACEAADAAGRDGTMESRVGDVAADLDPVVDLDLPALDAETRADPAAVADAYEVAYDGLLAAALD